MAAYTKNSLSISSDTCPETSTTMRLQLAGSEAGASFGKLQYA
jgi:hypothetical protein